MTVLRAHLTKYKGNKWLIMCGASFLKVDREEEASMHPTREEIDKYLANPFINQIQGMGPRDGGGWACHDLLSMWSNFEVAQENFNGLCNTEKVLGLTLDVHVQSNGGVGGRSLSKEFLTHANCNLDGGGGVLVRPLESLTCVRELIDNIKKSDDGGNGQFLEKEVESWRAKAGKHR